MSVSCDKTGCPREASSWNGRSFCLEHWVAHLVDENRLWAEHALRLETALLKKTAELAELRASSL